MKNLLSFLKTHEKLGALVFYLLAVAAVYSPVVFFGKSLQAPIYHPYSVTEKGVYGYEGRKPFGAFNVDVSNATITDYPINKLVGDIWRQGQVPLWNPHKGIGQPLPEQLGQSVFFPYQILKDVFPVGSWDFFLLGRLLVAGFFSFLFLRLLSISQISALLGGLIYMFSGSFTWFINNEEMVNPAMMIPVILWAVERMFRARDFRSFVFLATSTGLIITAGSPGVVLYAILLAFSYVIFRIFAFLPAGLANPFRARLKLLLTFLTVTVLGVSLASPLLFPFFDFLKSAVALRETLGSAVVSAWHFGFVVFPGLADVPIQYRFGISNGLWDAVGNYSGILPLYLILLGLLATFFHRGPLKKYLFFFIAFTAVVLLKNYGVFPFVLLGKLPLFQTVWSPRWSGPIWGWCLAMAAALGLEMVIEHRQQLSQKLKKLSNGLKFFLLSLLVLGLGLYQKYVYDFLLEQKDKILMIEGHSFLALGFYFGAVLTFLFLATWLLFYSKKGRALIFLLMGLVFLELWLWVPRGYQGVTLKFMPFLFGMLAIILTGAKRPWFRSLMLAVLFLGAFNLVDFFSPFGLPRRVDPFREPPYISFLKNQPGHFRSIGAGGVLMPNYASAFGISDVRHIDAITERHFFNFKKDVLDVEEYPFWFINTPTGLAPNDLKSFPILCGERKYSPAKQKSAFTDRLPYYSLLGVKYILVPKNLNLGDVFDIERPDRFPLIYNREIKIYENPYVLPRTFISQRFERINSYGQAQERLKTLEFDEFKRLVFLEEKPGEHINQTGTVGTGIQTAAIKSYLPSKVVVEADIGQAGILVLTDLFYPGWQATVNGEPEKIHWVDGLFRGIYLKPGHNQVIFSYLPDKFRIGLAVAGLALIVMVLWFLAGRYPRSRVVFIPLIAITISFLIYQHLLTIGNYLENKTQIHIDPSLATKADTQKKVLWERRRREMNFVSQRLIQLLPTLESEFRVDNFQFPEGLASPFQIDYRSGDGKKRRILIRVAKKDDPEYSYDPSLGRIVDFILKDYTESAEFTIAARLGKEDRVPVPGYLIRDFQDARILRSLFFYWQKGDQLLETRLYLTTAYYELVDGKWVLKAGNPVVGTEAPFNNGYFYDCEIAGWRKLLR